MMDDLTSEGDFQKEEEPASPDPLPTQQQTDPASPTVAVTPEPVARGDQATPREIEYQVKAAFAELILIGFFFFSLLMLTCCHFSQEIRPDITPFVVASLKTKS